METSKLTDIDGVRIYRREELLELFQKAVDLGILAEDMNEVTISQLDELVNGKPN